MKLLISALAMFLNATFPNQDIVQPQTLGETTAAETQNLKSLDFNESSYQYALHRVDENQSIKLLANLPEPKSSQDLITEHNCLVISNGGFYTPENTTIGWLKTEDNETEPVKSALLDGFISISSATISISPQRQETAPQGLQSGPLLILESQALPLKIKNDEDRRRSFAAVTEDNTLILGMILGTENQISGPKLADMPHVLKAVFDQEEIVVSDAINLDGGTASTFFTPDTYIPEINPIGTAICIQTSE